MRLNLYFWMTFRDTQELKFFFCISLISSEKLACLSFLKSFSLLFKKKMYFVSLAIYRNSKTICIQEVLWIVTLCIYYFKKYCFCLKTSPYIVFTWVAYSLQLSYVNICFYISQFIQLWICQFFTSFLIHFLKSRFRALVW